MNNFRPPRRATALLCIELLLVSASAGAHPPLWPEPKPQPTYPVLFPTIAAPLRNAPNFQAPSAADCIRPVTTREVPGRPEGEQYGRRLMRDELAKAANLERVLFSGTLPMSLFTRYMIIGLA